MNRGRMRRAIARHLMMSNYAPYERVLEAIKARGDIWTTSQGEYMHWWQMRTRAGMKVMVANSKCVVESSLENAVFEKYLAEFLETPVVPCQDARFSGEIWLTIDDALEKKDLLVEILRREGILNFCVAKAGEFLLTQNDLGALLETIDVKLRQRGRLFEEDIAAVRQVVVDKLAKRGLPLLRIWYHPRIDGVIMKAVFSPRYDVDRAITNVAHIRRLEQRYGVTSTLYLRAFCPFYSEHDIKTLASSEIHAELGLHGEFVRNARQYGDEFSAAKAEKERLEKIIGQPVLGLCLHGGERTSNYSENTQAAIESAGFLYDTTSRMEYYFPYRPALNGRLMHVYRLNHAFGDIKVVPDRNYEREFYSKVLGKMDEIYTQNGVFVLALHPVYFGFLSYLSHPRNLTKLVRFFLRFRRRVA